MSKKIICSTDGCKIEVKEKYRKKCYKCRKAEYDKKFPIKARFYYLKKRAKERGKEFTISLDYFIDFCKKSGLMEKRGKNPDSFTVDRIKAYQGYIPGNLQVLTHHENCAVKAQGEKNIPKEFQPINEEVPF